MVQGLLVAAYLHLRSDSAKDSEGHAGLGTAAPTKVSQAFVPVTVVDADQKRLLIDGTERSLVHIWATWCPPCRDELPGLLAHDGDDVRVIAIALDSDWGPLDSFFEGEIPPQVVRGNGEQLKSQLGIKTLPVTFLVDARSEHTLRFDGARDWGSEEFQRSWVRLSQ